MKLPPVLSRWFNERARRRRLSKKLFYAVWEGDAAATKECVAQGADLDDFLLVTASDHGHTDVVKALIDNGANANAYGDLALYSAALGPHFDVVTILLRHGAKPTPRVLRGLRVMPGGPAYLRSHARDLGIDKFGL